MFELFIDHVFCISNAIYAVNITLQAFLLIFFSELGDKTFFIAVRRVSPIYWN